MSEEGQTFDRKSIRYALGKQADLEALAADCVGLANANGGVLHLGVEDDAEAPPPGQRIPADLPDRLRKRIAQLTVNVGLELQILRADTGGEFVEIRVLPNPQGIASTTKGVYLIRVADETKRLLPDDLGRLWNDRGSLAWELQTSLGVPAERRDEAKTDAFCAALRASDRVKPSVKTKGDDELLAHYHLTVEGRLTNLGVLWVGRTADRAALQHAPVIQCIKYDAPGQKVRKWSWDDFSKTPLELIENVWNEIPEWRESYELPDGLFRKTVPHYDEVVVREVLANALVHRPYTTRGDIYVNLYPDRLEIHNPGLLPVGVTPTNILHAASHRNPHLARVFHDLKLMEREGSGFDRMYEVLLSNGHPAPEVREGDDRVVVTVSKSILKPEVIDFMGKVQQDLQPQQRESIVLALLAQHEAMTMKEVARALGLQDPEQIDSWMGRLREWGLVVVQGRTRAARYSVAPGALRRFGFKGRTSLKGIEDHRLRDLVLHDLEIYGASSRAEIHGRIGSEIPTPRLRRMLVRMVADGVVEGIGERRWRRYRSMGAPGQRQ